MSELINLNNYKDYKSALDKQMKETAEGFVKIGYLLKIAKETDILKDSGYSNVNDFAKAEYGIDKTMVSRFININDRFSENGNSPVLKTAYQGFGYAKLAIMLQLPDALNEELSPDYSKREIQALKEELDEEKKISDLEVYAERQSNEEHTELEQIVLKICEENPETYLRLHKAGTTGEIDEENIVELFAPAGEQMYSIRIPGIGRIAVCFKKEERIISAINMRSYEKKQYVTEVVVEAVINTLATQEEDGKTAWQQLYNMPFPEPEKEKADIAPVQQKKPAPKKETKVIKAKTDKKSVEKDEEKPINTPCGNDSDALNNYEVEGQKNISDYPDVMPEKNNEYLQNLDSEFNDLEAAIKAKYYKKALICAEKMANLLKEIILKEGEQC